MIPQSHFWAYTQNEWNQDLITLHSHVICSSIHNFVPWKKNLFVYRWMDEEDTYIYLFPQQLWGSNSRIIRSPPLAGLRWPAGASYPPPPELQLFVADPPEVAFPGLFASSHRWRTLFLNSQREAQSQKGWTILKLVMHTAQPPAVALHPGPLRGLPSTCLSTFSWISCARSTQEKQQLASPRGHPHLPTV